jgi:hypothetical protein
LENQLFFSFFKFRVTMETESYELLGLYTQNMTNLYKMRQHTYKEEISLLVRDTRLVQKNEHLLIMKNNVNLIQSPFIQL